MHTLNFKYRDSVESLTWADINKLREISTLQLGKYNFKDEMSDVEFFNIFNTKVTNNWNKISSLVNISPLHTIVDIGSGIGVPDLVISKFNKTANFYLVDKSEISDKFRGKYYDNTHFYYNSWDVTLDCIDNSSISRDRFNFLSPDDNWPTAVDLVLSTGAWCWHFPKEVYWKKVMENLKIGGILAVEILNLPYRDVVKEISTEFNSMPLCIETKMFSSKFKDQFTEINGNHGGFYVWKRKQ